MDPLSAISLLSGISSLLGYSFKDLLNKKSNLQEANLIKGVCDLLSMLELENDPLIGVWSLAKWDYESELHSKFFVSGKLVILYKFKNENKWKGTLFLRFQRYHSRKYLIKPDGWIARRIGNLIDTYFSIYLQQISPCEFRGTVIQEYRNPEKGIRAAAELENTRIINEKLVGAFANTNIKGNADFVFHHRRRWNEVAQTIFVK